MPVGGLRAASVVPVSSLVGFLRDLVGLLRDGVRDATSAQVGAEASGAVGPVGDDLVGPAAWASPTGARNADTFQKGACADAVVALAGVSRIARAGHGRRRRGGRLIDQFAERRVVNTTVAGRLKRLTGREREIVVAVARGASNSEIAEQLFIGAATVKSHVSSILTKLGLRDRIQIVIFSYESGLVEAGDHDVGH